MKKVIGLFFGLVIGCFGLVFSACDPNYDNLSISAYQTTSGQGESERLENLQLAVGETADFNFSVENAPNNYDFKVSLNQINNLFTVVSSNYANNKLHYTIQGVKPGKTTVEAVTYEGGKSCSFDVEVFESVTNFAVNGSPYVVVQEGVSYVLQNQHYFNYEPQNCKEPEILFTYDDEEVVEIKAVTNAGKTVLKLKKADGSFINEEFNYGKINLQAQILKYGTKIASEVAPIDLNLQIVPQIEIGQVRTLQRGGLPSTSELADYQIMKSGSAIKLIQNQIDDCYMLFEVQCNTAEVVMTVSSTICECTQVTLAEVKASLPTYTQPTDYQYCKYFAVQAVNVGTSKVIVNLSYSQNTSYFQTSYKKQLEYDVEVITAPYKVLINNLESFDKALTLFDNSKSATKFGVTVLDTLSTFKSVTVSLKEKVGENFVENKDLYNYLQLTYKSTNVRTGSFDIPYKEFSSNNLGYSLNVKAVKLHSETFYLSIKVNLLEGFNKEDKVVEINMPIKIEEGVKTFYLTDEFKNADTTTVMSRTLYMDIDTACYEFDGFIIENEATALLSDFTFDYKNNADQIFEVKQVFDDDHRTKRLKIYPKSLGEGIVRVTAQEGFYQDLQLCVCKSLTSANLVLVQNESVTKSTVDDKGNIKSFEIAFDDEKFVYLNVIKDDNQANLYTINASVDDKSVINVASHQDCEIGLKVRGVTSDDPTILTVIVVMQEITSNFTKIDKADGVKIFQVEMKSYSPISNISFKQIQEDETYTEIAGISVFRACDVGYRYSETMSKAKIKLFVTLKDGSELPYEKYADNDMNVFTSYGEPKYENANTYSITNFGTLKKDNDEFTLICDNQTAEIKTFIFALSLVDHDVTYTTQLSITVKKFTALSYIGISNYQDTLYLSGKQESYVFYTFMDSNADIPEFEVKYDSDNLAYKNLFTANVNSSFSEVLISVNKLEQSARDTQNGWGYIYFVPRTSLDKDGNFPKDSVQKIKVIYSDGTDKNYPELLSNAEEFMNAMTSTDAISKHYLILSTIDLKDYSYSDFAKIKYLTGSISGGNSNAKIININLNIKDGENGNYSNTNIGLFPKIAESGEINDIAFEGSIDINIQNIGEDKTVAIGLVTGQNFGKLNNVSVNLQKSSANLQEGISTKGTGNYVYVGGVVGINYGQINNGVDAVNAKKIENPLIFDFDDTKFNLTAININDSFEAIYSNKGTKNGYGSIAGKNLGKIYRNNSSVGIFNKNNYTAIVNLLSSGFDATGGIVGINGDEDISTAQILGQCISGTIKSNTYSDKSVGGKNCGGIAGKNYAIIQNCTIQTNVSAYDYVGGIVGLDNQNSNLIKNNVVQAVKNLKYTPMLTAISDKGNINAFAGNENESYITNGNLAKVYYNIDSDKGIYPIRYNQNNNVFEKGKQGKFVETTDSLLVEKINVVDGTQKFDDVTGIDANKIANMFIYQAKDASLQKYVDEKNKNRQLPFVFFSQSTIIVDSLSPEVLNIDSAGNLTLYKTGLAKLKITSVLDTTISDYLYVYVSNAFSNLIVEGADGKAMATNAFLNVYGDTTSQLQTRFSQTLSAKGDYNQNINVELVDANVPKAVVTYNIVGDEQFTQYSQYGNLIIFSPKNNIIQTGSDSVTLSTKYEINIMIAGVNVCAKITDFSDFKDLKDFDIQVRSLTGTKTINADIVTADIQPVDELTINVVQITDDENETEIEKIKFVKFSDLSNDEKEYFEILSVESLKTPIKNQYEEVIEYKNEYKFVVKYDYSSFTSNYAGQYYIVFVATNGKSTSVLINLNVQQLENIVLKNFYDVKDEYNPSSLQSNQVSSGVNSLLEVSIYPYFADFDYVIIKNDESNADKNNTLLMELVDQNLNFVEGAIYEDGIKISKDTISKSLISDNAISKLLIKYTTVSKATIDSIATINVFAYKNDEIVMQNQANINIVAVDSVYFTIDDREEADVYYLAKGLSYDLTLNLYGFIEDQVQVEIYHDDFSTNRLNIKKTNGKYQLVISDNITYGTTENGFDVEIKTYGRNIVDGREYRSGISVMKIVVVDYVILDQNLAIYSHNEDITKFNKNISIASSNGAVVSLPVGSKYEIKNQFVYGSTIEYDTTNDLTVNKVKSFENELTNYGTWIIKTNDVGLGVLGKFVEHIDLPVEVALTTNYLKLDGRTITPLKVNDYTSTNYYIQYIGQYKYINGCAHYVDDAVDAFNLSTDFVLDVYPNSTFDSAIPIYSYSELCDMQPNAHYILLKDITLPADFVPISTEIASLDGNGYSIILPSNLSFGEGNNFGLFSIVSENTILKNIKLTVNTNTNITILSNNEIYFGVLAGQNKGIITNCCVEGINTSQISVSIPNQSAEAGQINNYVSGLVALNNGFITNSHVSVNLTAVANVSGFVGINNKKISSSFVRDSMIINKSAYSSIHKTAGFVIKNGSSGTNNAVISSCYVCGETNKNEIYSISTTKALSSMPSVAGFVYSNYSVVQDCYSDIMINSSANCAGFVFENSGSIKRTYSTSTFTDAGQETYVFVASNKIDSSSSGTFEDCSYLVGSVNASANKQLLTGLQALDDFEFMDAGNFDSYSISSNISKTDAIWFYPSLNEEVLFKKDGNNMSFTYGKPELVAPNLITYSQKELDVVNTTVDKDSGETVYAYIETLSPVGSYQNPILISSAKTFESYILGNAFGNLNSLNYRIIADIDYKKENVTLNTFNIILTGGIEGNNMTIAGYSINSRTKSQNGGLLAQIGQGNANIGVVKNLNLKPYYINLPNTNCVGALAGCLEGGKVYNITADGFNYDSSSGMKIIGKNAIGGVIGFATNGFVMKNITSSISANASYDHSKSNNNFMLYQTTSNIDRVSYVGTVVGIATKNGTIQNISATNKCFVIGEVAGLLVGKVGANVRLENITQEVQAGQKIIATVYGGGLVGELDGVIKNANLSGDADNNFFKKADTQPKNSTAVGGMVGVCIGGQIISSNVKINLIWDEYAPSIVGGVVGEMVGGLINGANFNADKITINVANSDLSLTEFIAGGIVGKLSSSLSLISDSTISGSDATIQFCSTTGLMTVNLVTVMKSYIGGIIGQVINTYLDDDKKAMTEAGETYYLVKSHNKYVLNGVKNEMDISTFYLIYGGVLTRCVNGLVGAVFSDSSKLIGEPGEIIVYDNIDEENDKTKYASSSNCNITWSVKDNKNSAEIVPTIGSDPCEEDLRIGYFVKQQTELKDDRKIHSKTISWGALLQNSMDNNNISSPSFDGNIIKK